MIGVLHRSSGRGEMKIITKLQYESIQDACVSNANCAMPLMSSEADESREQLGEEEQTSFRAGAQIRLRGFTRPLRGIELSHHIPNRLTIVYATGSAFLPTPDECGRDDHLTSRRGDRELLETLVHLSILSPMTLFSLPGLKGEEPYH
jgi:hypothetical protein